MQGKEYILTLLLSAVLSGRAFASDDTYYNRFLELSKTQKGFLSDTALVETNNAGPNLTNVPIPFSRFAENGELAGIKLGMNMSQVVEAWGKPRGLFTFCGPGPRFWYHPARHFGGITLAFKENRLAIIALDLAQMKSVKFDNGLMGMTSDIECEKVLGAPSLRYPQTEGWFFGGAIAYCTNGFRTGLNYDSISGANSHNISALSIISVASADAQVPVRTVTFANLLKNPERYDYLRVRLEGYLKSEGNRRALYENQDQATRPREDNVWLAQTPRPGHEEDVQRVREGKVRVIGKVDSALQSLEFGVGRASHWDIKISELELLEEIKN